MPSEPPSPSISDFVESNRLMPPGTPFPGLVDLSLTPYAREWMDNMAPYSGIQHQAILKAAQVAATFAIENIIGYWMKELPAAIMYMSGSRELLEEWGTKRLEPMIDSMGIRDLIISQAEQTFSKSSRRTGDKMYSKQFIGGFLKLVSAQAAASQRSDSIRVLIRDETDSAPAELKTGEGDYMTVSAARTKFFGERKKITDLSTPTTYDQSVIFPLYENGDRREYRVPCPLCGKYQPLYWLPEEGNFGLRADTTAGMIISAYYLCDYCHDAIFDTKKRDMFNAGKWEPTAESESKPFRSYQINSLYSPPGTVSWLNYYNEWKVSKGKPEKMRGFTNLYGGWPFREQGFRPKAEKILELRGTYKAGTVPSGVLFLTIGADVQSGKVKHSEITESEIKEFLADPKNNPDELPRIEMEILGVGAGYRTWSIDYKVFYGRVDNAYSGAWEKIYKWAEDTNMEFYRADGFMFYPKLMFFDSGDGNLRSVVYQFTGRGWSACYPIKGQGEMKRQKNEKVIGDEISELDALQFRHNTIGDQVLYTIATNYYKRHIYNNLNTKRINARVQNPGFCDFPREYGKAGPYENYFKMLTAEEQLLNQTFHAGSRRNEALDCRVYSLCASDVWLRSNVAQLRREYVSKGATKKEAEKFTTATFLAALIVQTKNQEYYKNDLN
jgi:phage terminase large subunit GpA-like protein